MEIKALTEGARRLLRKQPRPSNELATSIEEIAISGLARFFTNEKILISAYRAARYNAAGNAATAKFRQHPDSWRAENILTHLENMSSKANSEASATSQMVQEGILSHVPPQRRVAVERAGYIRAQQILREKLSQKENIGQEYRRAATEMLRMLEDRLTANSQESEASGKILRKS